MIAVLFAGGIMAIPFLAWCIFELGE